MSGGVFPFALLLRVHDESRDAGAAHRRAAVRQLPIAQFPPHSSYNMALHYLNTTDAGSTAAGWENAIPQRLEIFFSNPLLIGWFAGTV